MLCLKQLQVVVASACLILIPFKSFAETIGDSPAFPLESHVDQFQVTSGSIGFAQLFDEGDELFEVPYNNLDGVGANLLQDAAVSMRFSHVPRADLPGFTSDPFRATGPNSQSCASCHNGPSTPGAEPVDDGSGGINSNAQRDPQRTKMLSKFIQRNTPHLFGSGALQNLAEEMTKDLIAIKDSAQSAANACLSSCAITKPLISKGVSFGNISGKKTVSCSFFRCTTTVTVDTSGVAGVAKDLIVRPYEWKGIVAFLRDFVRGAALNEIGMQGVEMVGTGVDQDKDGVTDEFTVGDITAITIYNAAQPRPMTMLELNAQDPVTFPLTSAQKTAISAGQSLFTQANCSSCHISLMTMNNPVFREPSANSTHRDTTFPSGVNPINLGLDPTKPVTFSFLTDLEINFEPASNGGAIVRLYSDLKWHNMGAGLAETIDEGGNGASVFITKPLWGVGSTPPYLHDGRAPTLTAAILAHGGEAQASRDSFNAMSSSNKQNLVEFLKNLVLHKPPTP